jgi:cyclophilin family peptidyl-prolyl cis-trans isomerase
MRLSFYCIVLISSALLLGCLDKPASNKFRNKDLIRLAEFTDRRETDSLLIYLKSKQPLLRIEAAYGLASVRDERAVEYLHNSLNDAVPEVRQAAAYALGQIMYPSSIKKLALSLRFETAPAVYHAITEALGKIAGAQHSQGLTPEFVEDAVNAILNFEKSDSVGINGLAKAAFWLHQSGWNDTRLMNRVYAHYEVSSPINRRALAYAASRYKGNWYVDTLQANRLLTQICNDQDAIAKTAGLAIAPRIASQTAVQLISAELSNTQNSAEVLISACRASGKMESIPSEALQSLCTHKHPYVKEEALRALLQKKPTKEICAAITSSLQQESLPSQALALRLCAAAGDSTQLSAWMSSIEKETTPFDRAQRIKALGAFPSTSQHCFYGAITAAAPPQQAAYTEAFIEHHNAPGSSRDSIYVEQLLTILDLADFGSMALCAAELRNVDIQLSIKQQCTDVMKNVLSLLELPRDVETYNEIVKTINALGLEQLSEATLAFNHPIDWELVKSIDRRQKAEVLTSKGTIVFELHVEDSPGTVANFIRLVHEGFYNDKYFHRVIPNFVAQGGCPRGDGMGSTDYTLRSEFRLHSYSTGSVGMASAGPDTESCQWFITHIPTPHLEGRYTIFAHVVEGMDIAGKLTIGDKILSIELTE